MALRLTTLLLVATTLTSALARAIRPPSDQVVLGPHSHDENDRAVSPALFEDLEELSRIVDISYCVGTTGTGIRKPFECISRCGDFADFELVAAWNTGPLLSDSCGYIALSHASPAPRIILAFRGTYSIANTLADLSTIPQSYVPYPGDDDQHPSALEGPKCEKCAVHTGFYSSWLNTRHEILPVLEETMALYPDYALTLVGHSLGGAVAALAALDFLARGWNPIVTTFGQPRIGNEAMISYVDRRFGLDNDAGAANDTAMRFRRVTHRNDPVPLLPLEEWGYRMHGGEIHITRESLPPGRGDVVHCRGREDPECIAGGDVSPEGLGESPDEPETGLSDEEQKEALEDLRDSWGFDGMVPPRYRLWQLFFAHRDYFWRLGLCVPGGIW